MYICKASSLNAIQPNKSNGVCVCVCARACERERERGGGGRKVFTGMKKLSQHTARMCFEQHHIINHGLKM